VEDQTKIIKMNSVKDCPVTLEDIKLAEAIYALGVPSLKPKVTQDVLL